VKLSTSEYLTRLKRLESAKKTRNSVHFELIDEYEFKIYNEAGEVVKHYRPSKTALQFHACADPVRAVKGPVGSGKSSFCLADIYLRAVKMPNCTDGVRRLRSLLTRNTYKDLLTSTFRTWLEWYGRLGTIYERSSPWIYKRQTFNDKDGTICVEIDGFSCDRSEQFESFSSVEFTMAYLNEARGLPDGIVTRIQERLGRFPSVEECPGDFWRGIILDTNAPPESHWFYEKFEKERPKGYKIFYQPHGVIEDKESEVGYRTNPEAENLENLPKDYYLGLVPGKSPEEIKVQLKGEYGTLKSGKPVYPEYNDAYHYSEKLSVLTGVPIAIGLDFGLTPAALICQLSPNGRLLVHREIISVDMGIRKFTERKLLPVLNEFYPQWRKNYICIGDPAGNQRAQTDEETCMQVLREFGIICRAAKTNAFIPRREAVAYFQTSFADAKPAFAISALAPVTRSGFLGAYHYKKIIAGEESRYKEEPEKNAASHPHDALQYVALEFYSLTKIGQLNLSCNLTQTNY
jgi:hypothetical protein